MDEIDILGEILELVEPHCCVILYIAYVQRYCSKIYEERLRWCWDIIYWLGTTGGSGPVWIQYRSKTPNILSYKPWCKWHKAYEKTESMSLQDFSLVHCPWGISSSFENIHLNAYLRGVVTLVVMFLRFWIFWKHWHDKVNLWQSRNALYSDFPHPPIEFPKTKLSLENIPTQGKKKWSE